MGDAVKKKMFKVLSYTDYHVNVGEPEEYFVVDHLQAQETARVSEQIRIDLLGVLQRIFVEGVKREAVYPFFDVR